MNELYSKIESKIIKWVIEGDKTAGSLTRDIIKIIEQEKNINQKQEQEICVKCGYPMFYHKPDDILYCHGCENTKEIND